MNITEACKNVRKKLGITEKQYKPDGGLIVCRDGYSKCPLSYFCDHGSTFYAHKIDDIKWYLSRLNNFIEIAEAKE